MKNWSKKLSTDKGEPQGALTAAYLLLLLLPWMVLFARAGAEICTGLIGLLFLWRSAFRKDWAWVHTPFMRLVLLAWIWLMVVVSPLALNPEKSFLAALPWIRYVLLFVAMRYWLLRTRTALEILGAMIAFLLFFCALDSLWQYVTGVSLTGHPIWYSGRLTGPLNTPKIGIFMARLLLPALIVWVMWCLQKPWRDQLLVIVGILGCSIVILLTRERTAFILTAGALIVTMLILGFREKKARVYGLAFFSAFILGAAVLISTQEGVRATVRATGDVFQNFSQSSYGQIFSAAVKIGKDNWLTGVGIEGLRELTPRTGTAIDAVAVKEHFLHAHNPYLEWFVEAGIPGLLLFIATVGCLLREARQLLRKTKGYDTIVPAGMLGVCLLHFFPLMSSQSYFSNWTGISVWFSLGLAFGAAHLLNGRRRS